MEAKLRFVEYDMGNIPEKVEREVQHIQNNSKTSTIFQTFEWHKAIHLALQHKCKILIVYDKTNPLGYYITYKKNILKFFFNYYSTAIETPYGVPVAIDDNHFIMGELIKRRGKEIDGLIFYLIPPPDWETGSIEKLGYKRSTETHVSYIHLSEDVDRVFRSFKNRRKRDIKKAERSGIEVFEGTSSHLEIYYSMHQKTCRRIGIAPHPKTLIKEVLETMQNKGMASIYLARYDNVVIAGIIVLYWNNKAHYWTGASSGEKSILVG